jgi:hypothetical protein
MVIKSEHLVNTKISQRLGLVDKVLLRKNQLFFQSGKPGHANQTGSQLPAYQDLGYLNNDFFLNVAQILRINGRCVEPNNRPVKRKNQGFNKFIHLFSEHLDHINFFFI